MKAVEISESYCSLSSRVLTVVVYGINLCFDLLHNLPLYSQNETFELLLITYKDSQINRNEKNMQILILKYTLLRHGKLKNIHPIIIKLADDAKLARRSRRVPISSANTCWKVLHYLPLPHYFPYHHPLTTPPPTGCDC